LIHQDAKILLKILKIHQQRNKASLWKNLTITLLLTSYIEGIKLLQEAKQNIEEKIANYEEDPR
jgi:hypothetical protein